MINIIKLDDNLDNKKLVLSDLLQVWDHNHFIMICNVDDIYSEFDINSFNEWSDTLAVTLKKENNCFISSSPMIDSAVSYLEDNSFDNYMAIVEVDPSLFTLVRGIISKEEDEFYIAINPEYEEYRPKTIQDKYNRLLIDYTLYIKEYLSYKKNKKLIKEK